MKLFELNILYVLECGVCGTTIPSVTRRNVSTSIYVLYLYSTYTVDDSVPSLTNNATMMNKIKPNEKTEARVNPTKSFIKHKGTVIKSVATPITKSRRTNTEFADSVNSLINTFGRVSPTIML